MEREEKLLAEFMAQKTEIALGGAHGKAHGWGSCCAVRSERPALAALRSELGNRLAEASAALGLESIGLVAYPEVLTPTLNAYVQERTWGVHGCVLLWVEW